MEIRALGAQDLPLVRDLRERAFGRRSDAEWERSVELAGPTLRDGRQFAGFEGDRAVATALIHDMTQWWHGRAVSMGGIGGVAVAPEARGRGLGRALMTEILERCAAFGHALSMLYPATTPLYRSLGWEHAGALHEVTFPAEALRSVRAELKEIRRATPDDADEVARVIGQAHREAKACGPVDWGQEKWRLFLADKENYYFLAGDGFLDYRWSEGNRSFSVESLVAGSERTRRALWALVGSGSSTAASVHASVSPHDPVFWMTRERTSEDVERTRWMLRVVDAPAAIRARGYPAGVAAEVHLIIDDPQLPANSGGWRLVVEGGEGRLERAAEVLGAVRVGAGGLAALYSGVPTSTLKGAGLFEGDAPELDAVFAAAPFSLDFF